jgi:hypothetical protein
MSVFDIDKEVSIIGGIRDDRVTGSYGESVVP